MKNKTIRLFIRSFIHGAVILAPLAATLAVIWYIVSSIDNIIPAVSREFPGLVFVIAIVLTALVGFFTNKFVFGKVIVEAMDNVLEHIPGIKYIYTPVKDVMTSFVGDKKKFDRPVWVKVSQSPEVWRIGFLTQTEMSTVEKYHFVAVYMPHSYAISGWVIVIKEDNIKPVVGMNAAEAMKFAVSGGVSGFDGDSDIFDHDIFNKMED